LGGNTCHLVVVLWRIWSVWQRRLALWVSKLLGEIAAALPKSGPGRLSSERLLLVTLVVANLGLPKEVSSILHRHPVHQGRAKEGPVWPGQSRQNVGSTHRAQENGSCWPGVLPRVVRPRGPDRLGNLITLGPLKGAFGWQWCVKTILAVKSPKKTL
jgi:hypothetical protein